MRSALRPALVVLSIVACGCGRDVATPDAGERGAAVEGAVPAPDGILIEAALRDLDGAWSRLQLGAGGAVALLPSTLGKVACGLLGVDASLGALVDGHATAYAVVLQRAGAGAIAPADARGDGIGWVVAMPLTDEGARRVAAMPMGSAPAGFVQRFEGGMRILARPDVPLPAAIAIAPRWLVVARDERDLVESGAYAFRTLPNKATLVSPVSLAASASHGALVGPIAASLESHWAAARAWLLEQGRAERERHGGRRPDFGDPEAIVGALEPTVRRGLASLAGAQQVRIEAETGADDVTVELRAIMADPAPAPPLAPPPSSASAPAPAPPLASALAPAPGGAPSTLGDARPLAEVPADAPLALLVRDDAEARAAFARGLTVAIAQILASRLRDEQASAIDAAFSDWGRGRGDWMVVGLAGTPEGGGWLRAPAANEELAARAVREVLELSRLPPLRGPLEGWLHRLPATFGPASGKAWTATFPSAGSAAPQAGAGVAWEVGGGDVTLGFGARPVLRLAEATAPRARWGDDARTARVLAALGDGASFAALARPLRFGTSPAPVASAPLALAWGRRGGDPWARIDIADELLSAGARLGAGF